MRSLAVSRHEWRQHMYAPLTYVFQAGFLLALMACIFLVADFYAADETSLRQLLVFLPWVALILVPALAMRAWADEVNDRSLELALSLPLGIGPVVAGKFLAGAAVLLITLLGTLPLVATLAYLGQPDWGVVIASYLGAGLLLFSFYAVALFAAALAREPVAAFVLGVLVLFGLLLLGWGLPARPAAGPAALVVTDAARAISPKFWLERIGSGHIEIAGVAAMGLLMLAALAGTGRIIAARRSQDLSAITVLRGTVLTAIVLSALVTITASARRVLTAVDLTAGREHTLHEGTLKTVANLPDGVDVTLYWSQSEASVPTAIRSHARRIEDLLTTHAARSGGRLKLSVRDPAPDTEAEHDATAAGIRRVPMSSGSAFFLGADVRHGARQSRIAYFDPRRDGLAEYDIARVLGGLARTRTPRVGILSPLIAPSQLAEGREGLSILSELKRAFDVAVIPHFSATLPEKLDVLVMIDATVLQRDMLYAIDQHVMGGGGLIVLIDPRLQVSSAVDRISPQPSDEINDISDLLLRWGVRYVSGEVVGDESFAAPVMDSNQHQLAFPFWLRIGAEGLGRAHAVTGVINELLFVEPGAFEITAPERAVSLVTTTARSGVLPANAFATAAPEQLARAFKSDGKQRVLAVALNGPFASAFTQPPGSPPKDRHRAQATGEPAVFAVADVDWIFDDFSMQTLENGGRAGLRPLNDNAALLQNMIDHAASDPALISIRSRGRLARPFTRVAALVREGQQRFRSEEAEIAGRIAKVEQQIARIPQTAGVARIEQLPESIQDRIRQLQRDLTPHRQQLRALRLRMREEVERLGTRLTVLNLLAGPVFAGALALLMRRLRRSSLTGIKAVPSQP